MRVDNLLGKLPDLYSEAPYEFLAIECIRDSLTNSDLALGIIQEHLCSELKTAG